MKTTADAKRDRKLVETADLIAALWTVKNHCDDLIGFRREALVILRKLIGEFVKMED